MNAFKTSVPLSKGVNFRLLWHILPYLYISVTSLHYLFIDNIIDISLKDWRRETHTQKRQILKPTRCDTGPKQCNNVDLWNSKMFNHPIYPQYRYFKILTRVTYLHWIIPMHKQDTTAWSVGTCTNYQVISTVYVWYHNITVLFIIFYTEMFFLMFTITEIFTVFTWAIILFFPYLIFM